MASITINVPDDALERVCEALHEIWPTTQDMTPAEATEFALVEMLRQAVMAAERKKIESEFETKREQCLTDLDDEQQAALDKAEGEIGAIG